MTTQETVRDGLKTCSQCERRLPLESFPPNEAVLGPVELVPAVQRGGYQALA